MKKLKELMAECESRSWNCCVVVQSITSYSVEIYTGYGTNPKNILYTDGHTSAKKAIKEALSHIKRRELGEINKN